MRSECSILTAAGSQIDATQDFLAPVNSLQPICFRLGEFDFFVPPCSLLSLTLSLALIQLLLASTILY